MLEAVFSGEGWRISYDWYIDPLGYADEPGGGQIAPSAIATQPASDQRASKDKDSSAHVLEPVRFDRDKAADRLYFPCDLGWYADTVFRLVHIDY